MYVSVVDLKAILFQHRDAHWYRLQESADWLPPANSCLRKDLELIAAARAR